LLACDWSVVAKLNELRGPSSLEFAHDVHDGGSKMVSVVVRGDRVAFEVEGWDKLWALKSQLEIPLVHIRSVRADPEPARGWWHGLRLPGTQIPGLLTAGSFYQNGGFVFYDVHDPENTVVIELDHEHYQRLVIEVENPAEVVERLQAAM
jgi:hypothetical protein